MLERLPRDAYLRMVWKNGLGVTEQIAVSPPGATLASGFAYRLSRAQVAAGGPFSGFPGCDRILVVVEGDGLVLARGKEAGAPLRPFRPFRFSGDEPIEATLERGPIADFNVIFDRARIEASCDVVNISGAHTLPLDIEAERFLYCASGSLTYNGLTLEAGDTLAIGPTTKAGIHLRLAKGPCLTLLLRLQARNG